MASVRKKRRTWYLCFLDHRGEHVQRASKAATKTEALRLAEELERVAERQRSGLEVRTADITFATMAQLWLDQHAVNLRAGKDEEGRLRLHLLPELGRLPIAQVTTLELQRLINRKLHPQQGASPMSVQTAHHLRNLVRRIFTKAKRWRKYGGDNPAVGVELPQLVRKIPTFANASDIPKLLAATVGEFHVLAAIAIYAGLREGEILELKRTEVDLLSGQILVERTIGNSTTKGKRFRVVPIPAELRPILVAHLAKDKAEHLFPEHRKHHGGNVRVLIGRELRTAKIRAGMVIRWDHICRRQSCRAVEQHDDNRQRQCSRCQMSLWPRAVPVSLTFHGLRHSYVSHLLMAGANPVAVQRLAGHATLEVTLGTYGHLVPDYMRAEVELLRFQKPTEPPTPPESPSTTAGFGPGLAPAPQIDPAGGQIH